MSTQDDFRPSPPSRSSTGSSKKSLPLDLSNLPPLIQPAMPTNTLLLTNLNDIDIFRPDNLQTIRELIAKTAPIHTWAPLKSFRRIFVSFFSEEAAIAVRSVWDGEPVMGEKCYVYFGRATPLDSQEVHLALPDAGKLFFISPPPSPPHDWEMRLEGAPNKQVHAEDLSEALAKLHHAQRQTAAESPVSPIDGASPFGGRATRSRSSTLIFHPEEHGSKPDLPAINVEDMTDEDPTGSPMDLGGAERPILAHTARPPVELMDES